MDGWEERFDTAVGSLDMKIYRLGERIEMQGSAIRSEIRAVDETLRTEIRAVDETLRAEIRAGDETLRAEIRAGDEETRRLMRILHEDLIDRIARIGEGAS